MKLRMYRCLLLLTVPLLLAAGAAFPQAPPDDGQALEELLTIRLYREEGEGADGVGALLLPPAVMRHLIADTAAPENAAEVLMAQRLFAERLTVMLFAPDPAAPPGGWEDAPRTARLVDGAGETHRAVRLPPVLEAGLAGQLQPGSAFAFFPLEDAAGQPLLEHAQLTLELSGLGRRPVRRLGWQGPVRIPAPAQRELAAGEAALRERVRPLPLREESGRRAALAGLSTLLDLDGSLVELLVIPPRLVAGWGEGPRAEDPPPALGPTGAYLLFIAFGDRASTELTRFAGGVRAVGPDGELRALEPAAESPPPDVEAAIRAWRQPEGLVASLWTLAEDAVPTPARPLTLIHQAEDETRRDLGRLAVPAVYPAEAGRLLGWP